MEKPLTKKNTKKGMDGKTEGTGGRTEGRTDVNQYIPTFFKARYKKFQVYRHHNVYRRLSMLIQYIIYTRGFLQDFNNNTAFSIPFAVIGKSISSLIMESEISICVHFLSNFVSLTFLK